MGTTHVPMGGFARNEDPYRRQSIAPIGQTELAEPFYGDECMYYAASADPNVEWYHNLLAAAGGASPDMPGGTPVDWLENLPYRGTMQENKVLSNTIEKTLNKLLK